jgi:hypothetical protein
MLTIEKDETMNKRLGTLKQTLTIHNLFIESISQIIVIKLITRRDVHECHHMR